MVNAKETALWPLLNKQLAQAKSANAAWLETKIKLTATETLTAAALEKRSRRFQHDDMAEVRDLLQARENIDPPELTEVVLATALQAAGATFAATTLDVFFADGPLGDATRARAVVQGADAVFLSTTLLRDWSELLPVLARLRAACGPATPIVVGGALTGSLIHNWQGHDDVAVLAVGYGELLVGPLVQWLRSGGIDDLQPNAGGSVRRLPGSRGTSGWVLLSGAPEGRSLDFLPTPDWGLIERARGEDYDVVHYESVRGCPFRCAFCNYPYLFSDSVFRLKSAARIADDWQRYVDELGVKTISCLDSLFTTPKKRLLELCDEIARRKLTVSWVCYARATDLVDEDVGVDEDVVVRMAQAGCIQVQIGVESGHQGQLDRMNKKARVQDAERAIELCRRHGITSLASFVVGYPGECPETLQATEAFLARARPDFSFLATFSTRVADVPVLSPENRQRFGLVTMDNPHTIAPYWRSSTMGCDEATVWVRRLQRRMAEGRWSLDASIFYGGLLRYRPSMRAALLTFQERAFTRHPVARRVFDAAHAFVDDKLRADVARHLPRARSPSSTPSAPSTSPAARGLPVLS